MPKFDEEKVKLDDYRFGESDNEIDANPDLKDYLRILYDQIKFENKMVGDFSVYGEYKIKPEMVDYLIKVRKTFQERKGDVVYVTTVTDKLILNFKITFNIIGKSQQAFLDIEEREVRFDEDNIIHKTRLAEIVRVGMPEFVEFVYHEWHVWRTPQDLFLDDNPLFRDLFERITMFGTMLPIISAASITFVNSMRSILPSCGPLGLSILNQFNIKFGAMIVKNPKFINDGLGMKRMLDGLMRKHNFFPKLAKFGVALPVIKDFVSPIKNFEIPSIKMPSISKDAAPKLFTDNGPSLGKGLF